jgi:WD40-like Beta Propeller Repeat
MNRVFCLLALLLLTPLLHAQQPPGSEIYLFKIKKSKGSWALSDPQNITNHAGYDNQPFFHPTEPLLYYVSAPDSGKTDIQEYNYKTGTTRKLTDTPGGEFSPTLMPNGKFISCILQRENGAQDLVKYPADGGAPTVIINTLTVGYHAWMDNNMVVVFALGEPNTLRLYSVLDTMDLLITQNPGRSIHRIPNTKHISFVDKGNGGEWHIRRIREINGEREILTSTLPGREDIAWLNEEEIVMSDGQKLFVSQPGKKPKWTRVTMPDVPGIRGITRLAANLNAGLLAMVVSE